MRKPIVKYQPYALQFESFGVNPIGEEGSTLLGKESSYNFVSFR